MRTDLTSAEQWQFDEEVADGMKGSRQRLPFAVVREMKCRIRSTRPV